MNISEKTRRIAEVNDYCRRNARLALVVSPRTLDHFRKTDGLPPASVLKRIAHHEFPENTSSPQHDFAYLVCGGVEVWWRMWACGDPADPETQRALVVFLPDEYAKVEEMIWQ